MVEIEINGKKIEAEPGSMIIEVADQHDVRIPRFCYHKKLSVAANCRMCLVEVGDVRKPLPACATPITQGMKVFTRSKLALDAQRAVMEFLLINHPLDCPVCDQGGECELQDVAMGYGRDMSRYHLGKRAVPNQDIGPLIETEMTRCIHCTRCVRFGKEVAGLHELGVMNRGEHLEISTLVERTVTSELSGNMIDLCPVGALTSKPYRFTARAWELSQRPSIAAHDGVGSHMYAHVLHNEIKRVVPKDCEHLNETWLSDRDRFSYEGLYHSDRVLMPQIKKKGVWEKVDWATALQFAKERMQSVKPEQLGALASSSATNEEFYLFQKFIRAIGSAHIDHRLQEQDFSDQDQFPQYPQMGVTLDELAHTDLICVVGSSLRKEQPIIAHRIRKASLNSSQVILINPIDYPFHFKVSAKQIVPQGDLLQGLAKVLKALLQMPEFLGKPNAPLQTLLETVNIDDDARTQAELIIKAKRGVILLGAIALHHPQAASIRALADFISANSALQIGFLTQGANSAGAWLMGAVPHRLAGGKACTQVGLNAKQMCASNSIKGFVLLGVEPEYDAADSGLALHALKNAECVIAMSAYRTKAMEEYADVILPITPHAEMAGTLINLQGEGQHFAALTNPQGQSRPAWKVLRVLANLFELEGFDYLDLEAVQHEIQSLNIEKNTTTQYTFEMPTYTLPELVRIAGLPIYAQDAQLRRATALQNTPDGLFAGVRMNASQANRLGVNPDYIVKVTQNNHAIKVPLVIDDTIADHTVYLASGQRETVGLGSAYHAIQIEQVTS